MIYESEIQKVFRAVQSHHECTDCGLHDRDISRWGQTGAISLEIAGGGSIVRNVRGHLREIHIIPHGGTELPTDLLEEVGADNFHQLEQLVHANSDIATRAIYAALVRDIVDGRLEGAVAAFHVSRILIDANRDKIHDQVPGKPYTGSARLYASYLRKNRHRMAHELAQPWFDAVNNLLENSADCPVYHHHTMDVYALSPRKYDKGGKSKRPAFQLFWRRPPNGDLPSREVHPFEDFPPDNDPGLAPLELLKVIASKMQQFFDEEGDETNPALTGRIDDPLRAPVMPFRELIKNAERRHPHVLYEVRKDLLDSEEKVEKWLARQAWNES